MTTSDYIQCYLDGNDLSDKCASCPYGQEAEGTDGRVFACLHKKLLKDAKAELEVDHAKINDVLFGLKCKGYLEVMDCDLCPWANYSPHCEIFINKAAIELLTQKEVQRQ